MQKAYDTVWRDSLWLKLWDMGVKGEIWRVVKGMCEDLEVQCCYIYRWGKVKMSSAEQGVAQSCSLSPILFSVFINAFLKEVEGGSI